VVRWSVDGKDYQRSFHVAKLAESYRSDLMTAARAGEPFDQPTGVPASMMPTAPQVTWLDHAIAFIGMKWNEAAPKYRKSLAESLTHITVSLLLAGPDQPDEIELRRALLHWAFNAAAQKNDPPEDLTVAVAWLQAHSRPFSDLADPVVLRGALDSIAKTQDGRRASNATITRRRSALHNCLECAVELRHLSSNPLSNVARKRMPPQPAIDPRRVASPAQARALLAAVRENDPQFEAFFATIYFTAARPGEALNLGRQVCDLPRDGWGELLLTSSYQRAGAAWTDNGDVGEQRQLKHRAIEDTRPVPAHPTLVKTLRHHIATYHLGPDGRLFVARTGKAGRPLDPPYDKPVSMNTIYRAWQRARAAALTEEQFNSPLARRPNDLRHACLSTWLNAGVAPVQVAEWAGHSVAVLLSVYAKCIDGHQDLDKQRIAQALSETE